MIPQIEQKMFRYLILIQAFTNDKERSYYYTSTNVLSSHSPNEELGNLMEGITGDIFDDLMNPLDDWIWTLSLLDMDMEK